MIVYIHRHYKSLYFSILVYFSLRVEIKSVEMPKLLIDVLTLICLMKMKIKGN